MYTSIFILKNSIFLPYYLSVNSLYSFIVESKLKITHDVMPARPKDGTPDQISAKIVGKLFEKNIF